MRRLYDLTQTTKKITTHDLNQRISSDCWPKELKELGNAFNHMLDRIETSFSRLIVFSDELAHELRTPINNLMGEAEIALSYSLSAEGYKSIIGSILEELNRIHGIIENIMFLARAENPQLHLDKTLLSINKEFKIVNKYYQILADEKDITISYEGEAMLVANSIMFRRMIGNLLSNAIKYTNTASTIKIAITETNKYVQLNISDNGIGVAPEHLPFIFQRFYRADLARSSHFSGTGLGLAIVKSIIDLHHGKIFITSTLAQGTSISIQFPK